MKKILSSIAYFSGCFCSILFVALSFYHLVNRYFEKSGSPLGIIDYSLYAWIAVFILLAMSLFLALKKQKWFLLKFMAFFILTSFSFDYWRTLLYMGDEQAKIYNICVMSILTLVAIIALYYKDMPSLNLSLSSLIIALGGKFFILPKVIATEDILLISIITACSFWLFMINKKKLAKIIAGVAVLSMMTVLFHTIDQIPGLHFYERKITAPAADIKVSIIVPVYNAEKTIERCLDSLRKQSLKDIEIICVDDGSTDNTPHILSQYAAHDARIHVIRQKNAYIGAARNRGLKEAKGEYVGFVDNDDFVSKNYYEELYKVAKQHQADIAVAEKISELHPERLLSAKLSWRVKGEDIKVLTNKDAFYSDCAYYVWNKIYNRAFLSKHNISFIERRAIYDDSFFSINVYIFANKIAVAPKTIYYFIRTGTTASIMKDIKAWMQDTKETKEMFLEFNQRIEKSELPEVEQLYAKNKAKKEIMRIVRGPEQILSEEKKMIYSVFIGTIFPTQVDLTSEISLKSIFPNQEELDFETFIKKSVFPEDDLNSQIKSVEKS